MRDDRLERRPLADAARPASGLPPLPGADGRSLVPLDARRGGARAAARDPAALERPVFAQLERGWGGPSREPASLVSVTDRNLRLLATLSGEAAARALRPRRRSDRAASDLAGADPEAVERLRALVDDYAANANPPWGVAPREVELDELRLNHLRALGYVVEPSGAAAAERVLRYCVSSLARSRWLSSASSISRSSSAG